MTSPEMRRDVGGVLITLERIYDQLMCLSSKVERLVDRQADTDDHEDRLRALEKTRWPLPTVSILIAVAAVVVSLYGK